MPKTVRGYAATSERSRGWLRYLYRKATTPDNWDKDGEAHPHWNSYSREPTASWARMDLRESSHAMVLMADATPAWREVYSTILDELVYRHTGYHAAKDWLDQIGADGNLFFKGWVPDDVGFSPVRLRRRKMEPALRHAAGRREHLHVDALRYR